VNAAYSNSMNFVAFNKTRGATIASSVLLAKTTWQRMKGLLGHSAEEFKEGRGLWIAPCDGIHTIGMTFPIDVAYLDKNGRALLLYHGLKPFRIGAIKLDAHSVLELPAGALARTHTQVGDCLEFRACLGNSVLASPKSSS
jgi:uncharacterized membrane protein (UPF0127 family)